MVPNHVVKQSGLSADALGVLIFLMSNIDGYTLTVSEVRERFGMGSDRWQRISKELRAGPSPALGDIYEHKGQRIAQKGLEVFWPEPIVSDTKNPLKTGFPNVKGNPVLTNLKPGRDKPETRSPSTKRKKLNARAREIALKSEWLQAATGLTFDEWKAKNQIG